MTERKNSWIVFRADKSRSMDDVGADVAVVGDSGSLEFYTLNDDPFAPPTLILAYAAGEWAEVSGGDGP